MDRLAFDDFVLDFNGRQLLRAGREVPMSPKAFTLLAILAANRPKAVSKADLQDRLWPDTFVVEKNLTNLIAEVRSALGDDPAHPRFIRTVQRFGYAFCGPSAGDARDAGSARRHNLPESLTSFVGRAAELAALTGALRSTRLLTLTGAGGCGKTRLALEAGRAMLDRFRDGVWLIDLAPLADASLVAHTAASALDLRQPAGRTMTEALAGYCSSRELLLILDNCEHLIAACAALAAGLLRAARGLSILATSRETLGVDGETVWRVPSLSSEDALRLLADRGRSVDPAFDVIPANAAIAGDVCRRLDGIPLAIELAAVRLKVLSLEQISARLSDRFQLLTGGSRTAVERQRTLEAAVAWSYDLLAEPERLLLRRASVFAGRWRLEAAEEVCADDAIGPSDALELLARLVDKSLIVVETAPAAEPRYRFLETVRQYARERLVESGEALRLQDRHLAYFLALARRAESELTKGEQLVWLARLHAELDNLRGALEWALAAPQRSRQALTLATALFFFWLKRGFFAEGQQWLERALEADGDAPPALRARALAALGNMLFFRGDFTRTRTVLAESAALARECGDDAVTGFALGVAAVAELELGDLAAAARLAAEGQIVAARSAVPWMQGPSLSTLAYIALHEGDAEKAGRLLEHEMTVLRAQGEKWAMTIVLFDLALLRVVQQRMAEARTLCAEDMALCQEFGDLRGIAWCLGVLAGADAAESRMVRATQLRGAMEALLETAGAPVQPTFDAWIGSRYFPLLEAALGEARFRTTLDAGRTMPLADAITLALEDSVDLVNPAEPHPNSII